MWAEIVDAVPPIGVGVGAVVAAALGIRHALSKLNLTTTSDSAQATLIDNLQEERDAHKLKAEELAEQNHLLREELAALKIYLRLKYGVTDEMIQAEIKGATRGTQ
jgi:hypothetical protein